MSNMHPYLTLTKFIVPLAVTSVCEDISEQALLRSLTSSTNAINQIASFAIAYKILMLFTGATEDFKYVSMVLVKSPRNRLKLVIACCIFTVLSLITMLIIGFTPAGTFIINDLHLVSDNVGEKARKALYVFSLYPFINGFAWVHAGLLLKYKYAFITGVSSIADTLTQIVVVVILSKVDFLLNHTFYIPLIALYIGLTLRVSILMIAYYKYVHAKLQMEAEKEDNGGKNLEFKKIYRVWLPLMFVRLFQRLTRPLINLFVARDRRDGLNEKDGVTAVAVLSVVYPICHVPYGWLNQLKTLEPTFTQKNSDSPPDVTVRQVRIFSFFCFWISAIWMVIMFWIPGVAPSILHNVLNIDYSLIALCLIPTKIMSFHPVPVILRDIATGWLIKVKRTSALYPSIFSRFGIVLILVIVLPILGLHGAVMGTTSLLSGFVVDSLATLIGAAYVKWDRKKAGKNKNGIEDNSVLVEDCQIKDKENEIFETAI